MSEPTCREMGPHTHPICRDCRKRISGNLFCPNCKRTWQSWTKEDERKYGHGPSRFWGEAN